MFNIPKYTGVEFIKSQQIAAQYGLGISAAVAKFVTQDALEETYHRYPKQFIPFYSDDAPRNQAGGYDKTPQWDGYMSSVLSGTPVMCYLKFIGDTYQSSSGQLYSIPDIFLETVLISVTDTRTIERTDITGRDSGSIKEFISFGDYEIEITAIISAAAPLNDTIQKKVGNNVYPYENMAQLNRILRAPISIGIECLYLNNLGIHYLAIDNGVQIAQLEGEYNQQRVTIPCLSDAPLIIKRLKND